MVIYDFKLFYLFIYLVHIMITLNIIIYILCHYSMYIQCIIGTYIFLWFISFTLIFKYSLLVEGTTINKLSKMTVL